MVSVLRRHQSYRSDLLPVQFAEGIALLIPGDEVIAFMVDGLGWRGQLTETHGVLRAGPYVMRHEDGSSDFMDVHIIALAPRHNGPLVVQDRYHELWVRPAAGDMYSTPTEADPMRFEDLEARRGPVTVVVEGRDGA